jgi:hypothetical protein
VIEGRNLSPVGADRRDPAALAAAALALASAAVTLVWLLGGTAGLNTLGGRVEELARERSTGTLLVLTVTLLAKLGAAGLALALATGAPRASAAWRRRLSRVGLVGGVLLAVYGGVLVLVGALVLAGVVNPAGARDEYALRWHVFFWDPWFLVWGVALVLAAVRAGRRMRSAR